MNRRDFLKLSTATALIPVVGTNGLEAYMVQPEDDTFTIRTYNLKIGFD